jgi:hypothetical protein
MSVAATLIAFASGLAAKVNLASGLEKKAEVRIRQLENENATLDRQLAVERQLCAHWREEAMTLARGARERHTAAYERNPAQAQAQHANAQMAQQAQAYNGLQGLGMQDTFQQLGVAAQQSLLGAQCLQMPADWVCTCIPDRASALRGR